MTPGNFRIITITAAKYKTMEIADLIIPLKITDNAKNGVQNISIQTSEEKNIVISIGK